MIGKHPEIRCWANALKSDVELTSWNQILDQNPDIRCLADMLILAEREGGIFITIFCIDGERL